MLAAVLAPATAGVKQAAFTVDLAAPAQDVAVAVTGRGEAPAQAVPPVPPVVADPAPDPATAPQAAARLLGTSTRARERGRFAVRLRCVTIAAPRCKGALTIALGPRRLTRGFSIAAGRKAVVRLRLSRADRRRLTRRRSLRSAVTLVTAQPDGSRRTTHEAVLRLKRARRR